MLQVDAKSGALKAFYSWRVQNPSEVFYDFMVDVDAQTRSASIHIGWNDRTKRNAGEKRPYIVPASAARRAEYHRCMERWSASTEDRTSSRCRTWTQLTGHLLGSARCFCRSYVLLLVATVVMLMHQFIGYCGL